MIWRLSNRFDPAAAAVADRHYSRQKPGTPQFMPSGSCVCLYAAVDGHEAVWGTSWPFVEHTKHQWAGAWVCTIFRNEGAGLASAMILDAIAATRFHYGCRPPGGMVTFVDKSKVKPTIVRGEKVYGWSFIKAGFRPAGFTVKRGYLALHLPPHLMPDPAPALGQQGRMGET